MSQVRASSGFTPSVRLNEIMPINGSVVQDQAGDFDPWIELHNHGRLPLDVGGMALGSDVLSSALWLLPTDTIIPARGYLLVWADGEPSEGPFHASFSLTTGHTISLFDKQAFDQALIDHVFVSSTLTDHVLARLPNGTGPWTVLTRPTPAALNAIAWVHLPLIARGGQPQAAPVVINEFMAANDSTIADEAGEYDDWIELFNPDLTDVDIGGLYLSDNFGDLPRWRIPAGTVISAGGHLLLWADDQPEQGPLHTNFKLSSSGEILTLVDEDGYTLLDWITFTAQASDVSFGRLPDGGDLWVPYEFSTPGTANTASPVTIISVTHEPAAPGVSDTVTVTTRVVGVYEPLSVTLLHDTAVSGSLRLFTPTAMLPGGVGEGLYRAQIPPQPSGTVVHYYVSARDALSQTATAPPTAPTHTYVYAVDLPLGTLFINEFMADNVGIISDTAGDFDDWIELYNAGPISLDLGGFYLTDDSTEPTRWQIPPGTTLGAGEHMLIWADGEPDEGAYHADFKLSANGETVGLYGHDGLLAIDVITFALQLPDVSWGRYPDGGAWLSMVRPTPGTTNVIPLPPVISAVAFTPSAPMSGTVVTVTALVTDDGAVVSVTLGYDVGAGFTETQMWDDGAHGDGIAADGRFGAPIPGQPDGTVVYYYVQAQDDEGLVGAAPVSAPDAWYRYVVGGGALPLFVNEFMADNATVISDTFGEFDDWIELYNAGPTPLRLGGMYLSDDLNDTRRWQIPPGTIIPASGHLLFWADGDVTQGDDHASFRLSATGEDVALFDTAVYGNVLLDGLTFPPLPTDASYGRSGDGGPTWRVFDTPTPGANNPL